jgi:DNA-binding HxlR family transcriptional regulator
MSPRCRSCRPVPEELRRAAELLERRWLLSVLYAALAGAVRFNEFRQAIDGLPARTLTERLRELEEAGLVARRVVDASPPYAEYRLTEEGRALAPVVEAIGAWTAARATHVGAG